MRTGKGLAAATLILDALKGTLAVILGAWLFGPLIGGIMGLCAFIGHLSPLWLKFKGGKGVATYLGVLFGVSMQGFFCLCYLLADGRISQSFLLLQHLLQLVTTLTLGHGPK